MATAHCSVCGQILTASDSTPEQPQSEHSKACASCRTKLSAAKSSTARTTILRPSGTLHVEGKAILAPEVEASEGPARNAALILGPEDRSSDSSVALRIVSAGAKAGADAGVLTKQFGSYEILGEISRGSFGVVYKARQQGLDRIVALKVLLAGVHASPEAVARFQREARAVAKLKHPNIVPVYDIGTYEGHHYFAMEFVEGEALSTLIAQKQVTTPEALAIAERLADAVESAHRASVIHRDIKPSNIIVDKDGQPHITDFGLAKQVDLDTKYTVSGTTLGTPAYMPPEQARGEIDKIDARSDVYAIGAVLYEMLTGRTPFAGRSLLEVVVAVINDPVPPPRQVNPKIHRDIQTIVLKCLEKDPRQRYESAAELRDDLRHFRSGEAIHAKPAGFVRSVGRALRRQALLLAAVAIVLAAVLLSYWRVQKSEVGKKKAEETARELQRKDAERTTAKWRPDWWFPPKKPEELNTEEIASRYKLPVGREAGFQGLVRGKDAPDLRDGVMCRIPGASTLVSPEDCRFFGDVQLEVAFHLDENGAKNGVRIGLQSLCKDFDGIPYVAELTSNSVRLIGPVDLYSYTNPADGAKKPELKLEVKAEKQSMPLLSGDYVARIYREGINLSVSFEAPNAVFIVSLDVKDPNLSSWVFKNTQLVLRSSPDSGVRVLSAEARGRYGGDDDPAFGYFYLGEYNEAERRLQALSASEDHFTRGRALYQLALIQEICKPGLSPGLDMYNDALIELERVRDDKMQYEANKLRRTLQLRKAIGNAKNKRWTGFKDELKQSWRNNETIGEPLAWELQGVLEQVLNHGDTALKLDTALAIFQRLGLGCGSTRLANCARELGILLDSRHPDLIALHRAYPTPLLREPFFAAIRGAAARNEVAPALALLDYISAFAADDEKLMDAAAPVVAAAIRMRRYGDAAAVMNNLRSPKLVKAACDETEHQVRTIADEDFEAYRTALLPAMLAYALGDSIGKRFNDTMERLAHDLIVGGRIVEVRRLHEVLRGNQGRDPRLAAAFADAVQKLALSEDAEMDALALEFLDYARKFVVPAEPALQQAACKFAERRALVDEQRSYKLIFTIQQAYPSPELVRLCQSVMRDLLERQRYDESAMFYRQARVAFKDDAGPLAAPFVTALSNIRIEEEQVRLLVSISQAIQTDFEEQKDEAALRQWRLELADIYLALNRWETARQIYQQVYALAKAEPALLARTGLRLAALYFLHPDNAHPSTLLPPLLTVANMPDELKLAVRLIATPSELRLSELRSQLRALGGPVLLTAGEWDLLIGIRLKLDGNQNAALASLQDADNRSSAARVWVHALASQLFRAASPSPDDDQPVEKP